LTKLLEQAFQEAARLTEIEQNTLAKWVLAELAAERAWDKSFAVSEEALDKLADEALDDLNNGKTRPSNLKEL
jgi:hypothetical protein